MPSLKKILVPVELHDTTAPVIQWAAFLAQTLGCQLTLLHVNESVEPFKHRLFSQPDPDIDATASAQVKDLRAAYTRAAQQELSQLAGQCGGLSVETGLEEGRAAEVILEYSRTHDCDGIVMGTHGRPWYQRVLLGSTAETVLRAAALPVMIVPNATPAQAAPQLKTLLVPTDFSPASMAGIEWGVFLAEHGTQEISLCHVIESPFMEMYKSDETEFDMERLMRESQQHPPRIAQPFWEHAQQVALEQLANVRRRFEHLPAQVELLTRDGLPAEMLLAVATEKNPDLLVIATHGRTGLRRAVLGSVTEKLMRSIGCPVFVVRSA